MKNITLEIAIQEFNNLTPGTKFKLKDLFVETEWKDTDLNYRKNLGKKFINFTHEHFSGSIMVLDKTTKNQQMYKRL